ncbi:MAG: type 4b pilus protein PilO2 [Pseudomonas sp.]|uniref:type 4b pilus protein PilO2 n=1 Tax=Pseudomonas sp. TaxID=306 RepID=UPI003BB5C5E1
MEYQSQEGAVVQTQDALVGVVRLGRKDYAVNLIWNPAESNGARLRDQACDAAERFAVDLIALRAGGGVFPDQYALGDLALGHQSGMPALAASVAAQLTGSLYGAWRLTDAVWWLVGVGNDGAILYDRAAVDEAEIRLTFEQGLATQAWDQLICPDDWQVHDSLSAEQNEPELGAARVRLKRVKHDLRALLVRGGALSLLAAAGFTAYSLWPSEPVFEQVLRIPAAVRPLSPPPPPKPWLGTPMVEATLKTCVDALLSYAPDASSLPGWALQTGRCDGTQVRYQLARQGGNDLWLAPLAARLRGEPAVTPSGNDQATLSWRLSGVPVQSADEPNPDLSALQARVKTGMDQLGLPVAFEAVSGAWSGVRIKVTLAGSLLLLSPLLAPLQATVLREVSYDQKQRNWTLVAEAYGPLVEPAQAE